METALQLVATYAALGLSLFLAGERMIRATREKSDRRLEQMKEALAQLQSFRDRIEGANVVDRLTTVETRQRVDETTLVRVDERLQTIDRSLALLCDEIRDNQQRGQQ